MDKDLRTIIKASKRRASRSEKTIKGHPMVYRDDVLIATFSGTAMTGARSATAWPR